MTLVHQTSVFPLIGTTQPETHESISFHRDMTFRMSPLMLDHVGMRGTPIGKRNMFAVTPAKLQDVRRLVDIEFHAFENERVNQVLSYRDYKKPAHFERSVRVYQNALLDSQTRSDRRDEEGRRGRANSRFESPRSNSRVNFKKVVDTEGSEIISFTKFEMKTYTKEEIMSAADSGHEGEPMMNRDWFALNERLRREYIGLAKHCCEFHKYDVVTPI